MVRELSIELEQGETIILSGFANRIGFWGGPGGRLVLTDKRLLFVNRRGTTIRNAYDLSSIIFVEPASSVTVWTIFLIVTIFLRNAIRVTFRDQSTQRFVVNNKNRWIALIDEKRKGTSEHVRATEG